MKPRTTVRPLLIVALLAGLFLVCVDLPLQAQDAPSEPVAEATEATTAAASGGKTLIDLFRLGGFTMWILLICSVAAVGLTIYNGLNLRVEKFLHPELFQGLEERIIAFDFGGTRELCEAYPVPISNILKAGLERVAGSHLDLGSVEKGMEEAATEEVAAHLVPINYLSVIAVISPMVGLLGTVSGMIKAFGNMAAMGMGRPERLADNISEALITTASGLIVGIPVMIIYFYYKNRYTGLIASLNRMAGDLLEKMKQVTIAGPPPEAPVEDASGAEDSEA